MTPINRETWLNQAVLKLAPLFQSKGYKIPQVKVSVGFPGGGSPRKRIGEAWHPKASADGLGSIFISPVLDESTRVLDVLVHELVHAVVGTEHGHGKVFKRCAVAVGLTGKMRSTVAGRELTTHLSGLIETLGAYPHGRLNLSERPTKKQSTRMIKMECPDCGYICRSSMSSIVEHGPVICPCNLEPMKVEVP